MSDAMKPFLAKVADGNALDEAEARAAFDIIMSGDATATQIGGLLMALRVRGETVEEITGAASAMRDKMTGVTAPDGAIDLVGTGGDGAGTFNISTGAAIVTAACGVPVAKHGNKAVSSKSGAANVLAALGVDLDCDMALVERSISEAGLGFLMAPRHHSAMRFVGPSRAEMGVRTIFNILGPLSNPARVTRQFTGVFDRRWTRPMAETLGRLGLEKAWVVHGADGLDEMTTTTSSFVAELDNGTIREFEVSPDDAGLARAEPSALLGGDAETNAQAIRDLVAGAAGAYRDVVLFNAAGALVVAGKADDLKSGVEMAADAVDSGAAQTVLERMVAITTGDT